MAAAAISILPITASLAVDIANEDEVNHTVLIGNDGVIDEVEVVAGETMMDVCDVCTIQIGDDEPIHAQGEQVVVIMGGKLN